MSELVERLNVLLQHKGSIHGAFRQKGATL